MNTAMRSTDVVAEVWTDAAAPLVEVTPPQIQPAAMQRFELIAARLDARLSPASAGHGRVVVVASAQKGDGRSTTALHLARALARGLGRRVLLVDGCSGASSTAGTGLASTLGVSDNAVCRIAGGGAHFAVMGGRASNLLRDFAELRARYDWIVVDTPALGDSADAALLGRGADGVLLVVRAAETRREKLSVALDALVDAPLVGCVLNDYDGPVGSYAALRARAATEGARVAAQEE